MGDEVKVALSLCSVRAREFTGASFVSTLYSMKQLGLEAAASCSQSGCCTIYSLAMEVVCTFAEERAQLFRMS